MAHGPRRDGADKEAIMKRDIQRLFPFSLLLVSLLSPANVFASELDAVSSLTNTLSWVHYTVGGVLLVVLAGVAAQIALHGMRHTRILGHGQLITARSRLRLLFGALVLAAILFPFLATHAPSLAGALIVVIALSTMIYRDSDRQHASSEVS